VGIESYLSGWVISLAIVMRIGWSALGIKSADNRLIGKPSGREFSWWLIASSL